MVAGVLAVGAGESAAGAIQSLTGNMRADAAFTSCGSGCTLGPGNSDADYAQWAAVQRSFSIATPSTVQIITFGYGGGINGNGSPIDPGGFEPYLSLFDGAGNFLASTLFGVTCPDGANSNARSGQCFDVLLDAGVLTPGNYVIAISAFENMSFAENSGMGSLLNGFTGLGVLRGGEDMHYAFDVIVQDTTPTSVPEPGGLGLTGCAILLVLGLRRTLR